MPALSSSGFYKTNAMLLNCINKEWYYGITTEGMFLIPLIIGLIFWMLYDLDRYNRKNAKEERDRLESILDKERQDLEVWKTITERKKGATRTTVISVQLSLL